MFQTFIVNFLISGSAAIISKTLLAPIERAKLILQTQTSSYQIMTRQRKPYSGLMDIFSRVPMEQGVWSLWRGNGVNVIRYFPSQALNFAFYDTYKTVFAGFIIADTYTMTTLCKMTAGGLAGACSTAIVFPLHFCQTRLSVDIGADASKKVPREFGGLNSCVYDIWKKDGIQGLYRGVIVSVIGIAVYRALYFGLFDLTKQLYHRTPRELENSHKPPIVVLFIMAQVVTSIAGFVAYPLDTVSRYMMMDSGRPRKMRRCESFCKGVQYIQKTHGFTGFYLGALTNVLRCTAGALVLVLYDEFLYYTNWKEKLKKFSQ